MKQLVVYLRGKGHTVDGLGWQAHIETGWELVPGNLERLDNFITWCHKNRLEFHITEMNVWIKDGDVSKEKQQADTYGAIFSTLLKHTREGKVRVNFWSVRDVDNYEPEWMGCLWRNDGSPRPAYDRIKKELIDFRPWYVTDAVTLEDGNLKISVYSTKESDGTYKHYAGMIATQGLFSQKHGYFESKIKFVTKSGEWGAFWLQSPTMGKTGLTDEEAGEEIDIVEHRVSDQKGSDVSNLLIQTIHWGGYGANHKSNSFQRNNTGINVGFHTYGFEWTENAYIMYLDGVETHRWEKNGSVPISQTGEYIILSCEARNASWAGNIPADGYKKGECYMLVDYVRVYSRNPYK